MTKTGQYQRSISAIHWLDKGGALVLLGVTFVLVVIWTPLAQAQTYTVLHRFQGSPTDGSSPLGGVIGDSAGNLYGATARGGASLKSQNCPSSCGVVYKVNKTGATVLYSFTGSPDGALPNGDLVRDSAGNLYGTTNQGGILGGTGGTCTTDQGCGIVFKLDTTGHETVLHSFTGGADGSNPQAGLIRDPAGNLYGTTLYGGTTGGCFGYGCGVVFKLDMTGKETVLYSFTGGADGGPSPNSLIRDSAGNLYGTTQYSGAGFGAVFKLDASGHETVLYTFTGGADGWSPNGLVRDSAGNLYGTTNLGGAGCSNGCGVVFKVDTTGKETVLYSFTGGADGSNPQAGLIRDPAGNLYGTTLYGGGSVGVVFKLDTTGTETVLYSFAGKADGGSPSAGVKRDSAGNLYGTTSSDGSDNCRFGCGVVFKLTP